MARIAVIVFAAIALLGSCHAQSSDGINGTDSPYHMTYMPLLSMKNQTVEKAGNPVLMNASMNMNVSMNYNFSSGQYFLPLPNLALLRGTLAPCGVLQIHSHNVDEAYIAISGPQNVSMAFDNGTVTSASLQPLDAFFIPAPLVHIVANPSCNDTAVFLAAYGSAMPSLNQVAAAAFNLPGGPFAAYTANGYISSAEAATTPLAYDPQCLARCNLGTTYGQKERAEPSS